MAKKHLIKTWNRMINLKTQDGYIDTNIDTHDEAEIVDQIIPIEQQEEYNDDDDFEHFLKKSKISTSKQIKKTKRDITSIINEFDDVDTVPHTSNILEYWQKKKDDFKELYELSEVINAIPVTQVTTNFLNTFLLQILMYSYLIFNNVSIQIFR